ncbi:MAG: thioredoxin-dependent thiol peroxidase [Alphaproteobacteria bacterium]|nr:thioredoxin-dependent thiol peroxidase [Alphaproteobacteria bacterium]
MGLAIGENAPDFTLPIDDGGEVSLSRLRGKKIIVYFYPKDATPGCTQEACSFRDNNPKFKEKNTIIIGISRDSIKSHKNFKEKQGINFILASDEDGKVCEEYGVWVEKSMYGRKYFGIERTTFLIDEAGIIAQIWRNVKVPGHVEAILELV